MVAPESLIGHGTLLALHYKRTNTSVLPVSENIARHYLSLVTNCSSTLYAPGENDSDRYFQNAIDTVFTGLSVLL